LSKIGSYTQSAPSVAAVSVEAGGMGGAGGATVTNDALMAKLVDMERKFAQMHTAQGELELRVHGLYSGSRPSESRGSSVGGRRSDRAKSVVCYGCKETGHFKRDCPHQQGGASGGGGPQFYPGVVCNKCGNNGHYASGCKLSGNI
jgi:hypothetical protein